MNDLKSDLALLSACLLLAIDPDVLEERAAIFQYDAGMTRDQANREALFIAMTAGGKRYSRELVNRFFDLAAPALEHEQANGWTRRETNVWILAQIGRRAERATFPTAGRVAG